MIKTKFSMFDAVQGIGDIRHIVAIMFGTTDRLEIKEILNKAGYPFGCEESFARQLRDIHEKWLKNGKDISKVKEYYFGQVDPFNEVEKQNIGRNRRK